MSKTPTGARRVVQTYAERDGWLNESGPFLRRVAQCQCCAETHPVRGLYVIPVPDGVLAGDGPTMCVCARCRNWHRRHDTVLK
jgi:hypothetical protein